MQNSPNHPVKNKGIYLLPNLFTTAGLFSGFYAVISSMNGHFELASIAIFIAMICDGLDGRVARLTNTQSDFGAEYDSLADMVSFGMAPAILAYNWALQDLGKVGWLAAFIYCACAALRLARFNTQVGVADKRYFQGLASPAAAALIAGSIWSGSKYELDPTDINYLAALITALTGLLMVSNFRYHSFKEVDWRGKVNFVVMLLLVGVFVIISVEPAIILCLGFYIYALSGPVITIKAIKKLKVAHIVGDELNKTETQQHSTIDDINSTDITNEKNES
ncbi:CDP-diacylglycerol--serine O-phosphatidyltransferase [Shewanella sp. Arc9-LZ]|jgi:CDP-diacylglycerol--serine O-phosphatidyltransferase|uniref:CDP-diacylglycerol--serine O-phosphatidyltransferase n=1 Tax=Shewanella sp. Arc9-LZ TaxID=2698686 RepID=UPI00137BC868|nr:CDP-diacylglycerol--serine O-phosphatidyltransferase [Shewanella sp. Arc9-LZ]QHS14652.1 CDP-diacylglycerol--serine O-phosphatidyltransferase [Shewanella sp. Arc9-LZ]